MAHFTTLLPEQIHLQGEWYVAVVEISWPDLIENVTEGKICTQKISKHSSEEAETPKKHRFSHASQNYGMVAMLDPRKRSVPSKDKLAKHGEEEFDTIPAGFYPTIDTLLETIFSKLYNNNNSKADPDTLPVNWKVCSVSQLLDVIYKGAEDEKIIVRVVSRDLKNILGTDTLTDCDQEGGTTDTDIAKAKQLRLNDGENIAKRRGKYPVDLTAGCHTMFLYCELVQNEISGDTQTALLRALPLSSSVKSNHQNFTKLQWRRLIKCSIQSITISLRSETGDLIPFFSRGRTNLTLQFKRGDN